MRCRALAAWPSALCCCSIASGCGHVGAGWQACASPFRCRGQQYACHWWTPQRHAAASDWQAANEHAFLAAGFTTVKVMAGEFLDNYLVGPTNCTCPPGMRIIGASAAVHAYPTGALAALQHLCAPPGAGRGLQLLAAALPEAVVAAIRGCLLRADCCWQGSLLLC